MNVNPPGSSVYFGTWMGTSVAVKVREPGETWGALFRAAAPACPSLTWTWSLPQHLSGLYGRHGISPKPAPSLTRSPPPDYCSRSTALPRLRTCPTNPLTS